MNTKKFFINNIKTYLVLYIVSFAIMATAVASMVMTATMLNQSMVYMVGGVAIEQEAYDAGLGVLGALASHLMPLLLVLLILVTIAPLFAMGARYSLPASDTYKQVAQKRNAIRLISNGTLLTAILAIFTVVFWLGVIGIAIRHGVTKVPASQLIESDPESGVQLYYVYSKQTINFGYYALVYALALVSAIVQYFISYLFVSRCNRIINSIFVLILGELILALAVFSVVTLINNVYSLDHPTSLPLIEKITGTGNSSILFPLQTIIGICEPLIYGISSEFTNLEGAKLIILIISTVIFVVLGVLGLLAMIYEKDPSGEYAGKPETDNNHQFIIFHVGAFFIGFTIASYLYFSIIAVMILEVLFVAIYFVFLGVLRRNFRINLKNLIPYVSISVVLIVFALVLALISRTYL